VSDWRVETAADLAEGREMIEGVLKSISGEPTKEELRSVWLAYVKVEKSVAFIKIDLDEENPGRFIRLKPYAVPDERQALQFALRYLKKGSDDFAVGDFQQALRHLRESRNYLRALLREKRLARARRARRA
jgi:hypothetical protein